MPCPYDTFDLYALHSTLQEQDQLGARHTLLVSDLRCVLRLYMTRKRASGVTAIATSLCQRRLRNVSPVLRPDVRYCVSTTRKMRLRPTYGSSSSEVNSPCSPAATSLDAIASLLLTTVLHPNSPSLAMYYSEIDAEVNLAGECLGYVSSPRSDRSALPDINLLFTPTHVIYSLFTDVFGRLFFTSAL